MLVSVSRISVKVYTELPVEDVSVPVTWHTVN